MSYLDDPRVFFAAERTLLAWQRTAIALIGLGFVVERFGLFMRYISGGVALPPSQAQLSLTFGLVLLLIGAAVSALSALQHRRFLRELTHPEIPRGHLTWLATATNVALCLSALAMATWFVIAG